MGDKLTILYLTIAYNVTLPKMNLNQSIVFNSIINIKKIDYVTEIGKIIPAENIQFVSRINDRFCKFFNSQTIMENVFKTHSLQFMSIKEKFPFVNL